MAVKLISKKRTCSLALSKAVFLNLYWKDDLSGTLKTGGFCKHKSSTLYNQAVEVISQEAAGDIGSYYPNCIGQPVRRYLIEVSTEHFPECVIFI